MNRIGRREAANGAGVGEFDSIAFLPSFHLRRRTDRHASSFSETGFDGVSPMFPVECETFVRERWHIDRSFSLVFVKPDLCRLSLASAVLCNPFDGKKERKIDSAFAKNVTKEKKKTLAFSNLFTYNSASTLPRGVTVAQLTLDQFV